MPRWIVPLMLVFVAAWPSAAHAQLGTLVSPGPLSKAHASLSGIENCVKCHEPGKRVTADRCLGCHKPVAERIAQKKGVHRQVTGNCVQCHVEHAGRDGELRPFDTKAFDHQKETGFPLDGRHAPVATDCAKCHRTRSFLTASPTCQSCHKDPHQGSLGAACARCHPTSAAFADARRQFDHATAKFQLTGAHRNVECARCHADRRYTGIPFANCTDCHKSPHGPKVGTACTSCHTTAAWKTTQIDHARTGFPLKGRHATVPCASCHKAPPTKARVDASRCALCHADVHRGGFKEDCAACHDERGFARAPFDHQSRTKFPLTGRHAALACAQCHPRTAKSGASPPVVDFRGRSAVCATCHTDAHKGELGTQCERCHGTSTFRVTEFQHPRLPEFFAGQHAGVSCAACHVARPPRQPQRVAMPVDGWTFKNLSTACATCHADVHLGQVGADCAACHTIAAPKFAPVGFSHDRAAFTLTGAHQRVECRACHRREAGRFPAGDGEAVRLKGLGTTCASCHQDPHLGQLGQSCDRCHTTSIFKLPGYTHSHAGAAAFHTGAHTGLACNACHKRETGAFPSGSGTAVRYAGLGTTCARCHQDVHRGALGGACEGCHAPDRWRNPSRAFHKASLFPLEGRHLTVECASCHVRGAVQGTPVKCYDCHWIRRQDDPYQTRLGLDCGQCHRPIGWTAVTWNHASATGVPLSAMHMTLGCDACHRDRTFRAGGVSCFECHREDYQRSANPPHAASGFPTTCDTCHRASHTSWHQATFSHSATYPLVGVHATQACQACHKNNVYRGTPRDCVGCHRTDYDRSQNPNHAAAGFPTTCETCHQASAANWKTTFNHNAVFPLLGVHATQACQACHKNNVYRGTPRDCVGCHRTDYDRSQNPNHAAAGFPTTCETCHQASAANWNTSFNHNAVFPLQGVHATQPCLACHKNNVYRGTPRDCVGCHRTDYDRSQNPNHAAAGFPTTCETCHQASAASWKTTFNHNAVFPLQGVHATQPCLACHKNNVYRGTPRDCYPCHQANYDQTRNPNHRAAGFPTSCDTCHRTSDTSWSQGRFNHTWFPITSGKHAGNACSACHQDPNNYKSFTCLTCHDRARTDDKHKGRSGYRYDSLACYSCHPQGRSD